MITSYEQVAPVVHLLVESIGDSSSSKLMSYWGLLEDGEGKFERILEKEGC
jgi:hypothetical protein